ncbi:MAG: HAMP domain-containing sensor histidine kinase, partial [Chloroflexota bacterium]
SQSAEDRITLAVDATLWSDELQAVLTSARYHLVMMDLADSAADVVSASSVDAVIASTQFPLNTELADLAETRNTMLLLVVPHGDTTTVDDAVLALVDAIVPAHPVYLEQQLTTLLQLRKEKYQLQRDIDDLREQIATQRRKTKEIEILKNAIVRNVSHELRTPLLQVKSAVSLIGEDMEDKKLITFAQNATAKLETHVKNITMLGHSLDINPGPIILRDAVDSAKRNLTRIWTRRSDADRIVFKIEDNLPPLIADRQGLITVLQQLMDNGIKFGDGKPVEIIGRRDDERVYVGVKDNGIGIEESDVRNIFDSFYQVDGSSTRRFGGAGVGLALVKLILDHHDVKIHVDSEVGKGSTFWFHLPFVNMDDLTTD